MRNYKKPPLHILPLFALCSLAACPDPAARFDEFVERVPDAAENSTPDAAPLPEIPDVSGDFFMGFSIIIAPDSPVVFHMTNVLVQNGDGTATLTTEFQPLAVGDHTPVGDLIIPEPALVNSAGEFTFQFVDAVVPGAANPITGSNVTFTLMLRGRILDSETICGDIPEGMVTSPSIIDVSGSTWGARRYLPPGDVEPALLDECPASGTPDAGVGDATVSP